MKPTSSSQEARSAKATEIQAWILDYLAEEMDIEPHEIDVHTTFIRNGISSMAVISMAGALEERLGLQLEERWPFEYPTVHKLSAFLATASPCPELPDQGA